MGKRNAENATTVRAPESGESPLLPLAERIPLAAPDGASRLLADAKAQDVVLGDGDGRNGTLPAPGATTRPDGDLSELALVDRVEVVIVDPRRPSAKVDTGLRVYIRSLYSNEVRAAIEKARARKRATLGDGVVEVPVDQMEDAILEQIISATIGWSSGPSHPNALLMRKAAEGRPAELWEWSPENVRKLYMDVRYTWIARQVEQAYLDLDRFFMPPSTN